MNGAILLAATDQKILSEITDGLARPGIELISACTNEECMKAVIGKPISLALISLAFPGMADGSLANLLHVAVRPDLPIIGLAAPGEADPAPGLITVLFQPLNIEVLQQTVAAILNPSASPAEKKGPVDMSILMEASCDERELALELIQLFFETTDECCERLDKAMMAGDAAEISAASHKCCGASASCGMIELERRMRTIESTGKDNRLSDTPAAYDAMKEELASCRHFLEHEFNITIG